MAEDVRVDNTVTLPALPMQLSWSTPPSAWYRFDAGLRIEAGPVTDLFADPGGRPAALNAPRLQGSVGPGDFQLSARVTVGFGGTYDAGALLVWSDRNYWAKLCFELSPQGLPMIVSVVTHGRSDDANGFTVDGGSAWLRVSRLGAAYAFHASIDGLLWHFVRHFDLEGRPAQLGFVAQSPTSDGCGVSFDHLSFRPERLANLRDGT
jgi:regulation of enolase protein 1 (concanavalin A-like superfamily)